MRIGPSISPKLFRDCTGTRRQSEAPGAGEVGNLTGGVQPSVAGWPTLASAGALAHWAGDAGCSALQRTAAHAPGAAEAARAAAAASLGSHPLPAARQRAWCATAVTSVHPWKSAVLPCPRPPPPPVSVRIVHYCGWRMAHGAWRLAHGAWCMADGGAWRMLRRRPATRGPRPAVAKCIDYRAQSAAGPRQAAAGRRGGGRLPVAREPGQMTRGALYAVATPFSVRVHCKHQGGVTTVPLDNTRDFFFVA